MGQAANCLFQKRRRIDFISGSRVRDQFGANMFIFMFVFIFVFVFKFFIVVYGKKLLFAVIISYLSIFSRLVYTHPNRIQNIC